MKSETFSNALQVLTSIAILVGIGLVIYELRQNKDIAIAEIATSGGWDSGLTSFLEFLSDGRLMPAYVKACMNEQELTEQDILIMDKYFAYERIILLRMDDISETLDLPLEDLTAIRQAIVDRIRSTEIGKDYAKRSMGTNSTFSRYAHLLDKEPLSCKELVAGYQQGIAQRAAK